MLRLGRGHHTLTCRACGAPLSALKAMPVAASTSQPAVSHQPVPPRPRQQPKPAKSWFAQPAKPKKKYKKRKGLWRKIAEEAFDLVEDIFD
ncbi:hypothetical protein [uncultured Sulfitobacter sp.]|uniref:hypothetical protein n=1 Tax=uncultured Sulfitobacter sp. TaxID=191468 RepID=UPI0026267A3D|nr:hypothetical protein [uncultured Sulfitobacter sp.]